MGQVAFTPTALEIACGLVLGGSGFDSLPRSRSAGDPLVVLREVVLRALLRTPCVVSFSGGRDSSIVLAVATSVAREHGLPLPVPHTLRFPRDAATDESAWQTAVVRHLDLPDWTISELDQEVDWVGPYARTALRRHGLLWPPNTHFLVPAVMTAAGGSLLTGSGGDQVLAPPLWSRLDRVRSGAVRPRVRDLGRAAVAWGPRSSRARVLTGRLGVELPWLTAEAQTQVRARMAAYAATEPVRWGSSLRTTWATSRQRIAAARSSALLGSDHDVVVSAPLDDPAFLQALDAWGPLSRTASRTQLNTALFGQLLPAAVLTRATKARFDQSFFGDASRAAARSWTGSPIVPGTIVDSEALRTAWAAPTVDARSSWLLQALVLADG